MRNRVNYISAIVLQLVTIAQGLILPHLIIGTFGSDINGLVSSITQFLSFISLLEGGLGAVVLAELYRPLKDDDLDRIREVLWCCQKFFNKIAVAFILYTIGLAIVYPVAFDTGHSFWFSASLVIIMSISTLAQYLFAIKNKLLLQASQKVYIVNFVMTCAVVANLSLSVLAIWLFPEIHLVKAGSVAAFLIQPILFSRFVDKKFSLKKADRSSQPTELLKNRWSGFGQNLAYFINMNTDIAVITVFTSLSDVSVYAVYMLAINALRSLISSATNSYQAALGKDYVECNPEELKRRFAKFENTFWVLGVALFSCCLLLINPFVELYTTGVADVDYARPHFAALITIAYMLFCVREPYRLLVLAAGKFKETDFGALVEAGLNISISVILIIPFGLTGVAIGTLIATLYRLLYLMRYLKLDILMAGYRTYVKFVGMTVVVLAVNVCLLLVMPIAFNGILDFLVIGCVVLLAELAGTFLAFKFFSVIEQRFVH